MKLRLFVNRLLAVVGTSCSAFGLQQPVVVSVYQGTCRDGDFQANLAVARQVVGQALQRGSHFLAFPECFLSGYDAPENVRRGARGVEDPDLRAFVSESAAHSMVVLAGLARLSGTNLYNSVVVIHRGRLLGIYDKVLLTPSDREVLGFSPGQALPVFEAHGARFGVLICADTSYPHVAMAAKLQGADILFTPHYNEIEAASVDDHLRWVRNCHVGLACQYQVTVARANVVKTERPGRVGVGDTFILGPQGQPLREAGLFRTELCTAVVSPHLYGPPTTWASFHDTPGWLRTAVADLLVSYRPPDNEGDLDRWLENMAVDHGYSLDEMAAATGLDRHRLEERLNQRDWAGTQPRTTRPGEPIRVLPFPGGRHPRIGFFDGARNPQRETKASVFPPWHDGGYAVVDVPEAIFSNLGLLYLAHTHIPTIWDQPGVSLPRKEWRRDAEGRLQHDRTLPNGIAFGAMVKPGVDGVGMDLWLRNGTAGKLTGLRVQNCVMLGYAKGFDSRSLSNKVFDNPFAAARSSDGKRWIVTAWEACGRAWGNEQVPCVHADPVFPDCPPGETVRVAGWLSFFEGADIHSEFERLRRLGVPGRR